ncbi:MAG: hypothetical protein GY854_16185 [Deltaproteobacteria bacterium]|nr:hypothetical protein [Deltaproteobacteria bacterium]
MDIGAHIPAYLFCEQFASEELVLDVMPPDEQGALLLARTARAVTVVQTSISDHAHEASEEIQRVTATQADLPFLGGSFGLVLFFAREEHALPGNVDAFLRSARTLVGQKGLIALTIPNRDAKTFEGKRNTKLLGFFELERALRRHFPHVTIFAERPLHGATLTPLGRRGTPEAPLLEDRLLPDGGETPSHFLALCAPRYRRVDDSMIAQLPYELLVDKIRDRLEQLAGKMDVAMAESGTRLREIERLEKVTEKLKEENSEAEILKREKTSLLARLAEADRQLHLRDERLAEVEVSYDSRASRLAEIEQQIHDSNRKLRQAEQRAQEVEQRLTLAFKEREEAEKEQERALAAHRTAHAESKTKQREVDDVREQMAGLEAELAAMHEESARLRREGLSARERATRLELELKEIESKQTETSSLEAELSRMRSLTASERERLEQRVADEHARLLEEVNSRATVEQKAAELENQLNEALADAEAAKRRNEAIEEKMSRLQKERDFLERDRREAERASDEMARIARERSDELKQQKHQIDLLNQQASQAEIRVKSLSEQLEEMHTGLEETETELIALRTAKKRVAGQAGTLEERNAQLVSDLEATLKVKDAFEDDVGKLRDEINSLTSTRAELQEETHELREKIESVDSERTVLEVEVEKLGSAMGLLKTERVELDGELLQVSSRAKGLEEARAQVAGSVFRVDDLEERVRDLEERLQEASAGSSHFEEEATRYSALLADVEEKLGESTKNEKETDAQLREASDRVMELEENLRETRDGASFSSKELARVMVENREHRELVAKLDRALNESEEERKAMDVQMHRLVNEKEEELLQVTADLEKELRSAVSDVEAGRGEIWKLSDEIIRVRAETAAAQAAFERKQKKLNEEYKKILSGHKARIIKQNEERTALRETVKKLKIALKKTEKRAEQTAEKKS